MSLDGLNVISADTIFSNDINYTGNLNNISATTFNYLAGTTSNLQNQINNLNSSLPVGGGTFLIYSESSGFNPSTNYGRHWTYGSGSIGYQGISVPDCNLVSIAITSSQNPSSDAYVVIEKNVGGQFANAAISLSTSQSSNLVSGLNCGFALGDTCTFRTYSGSGGGTVHITAIFTTNGVIGPQGIQGFTGERGLQGIQGFTGNIGPQGIQGFTGDRGLQGIQGIQGLTGYTGPNGLTPVFEIGSVTAVPYGVNPSVSMSGSITNPKLNFGIVQGPQGYIGNTPIISIGTVEYKFYYDTSPPSVTLNPFSTTANPIFDFILKQGPQGPPGDAAHGTDGTNGKNGTNGTNGTDGKDGVVDYGIVAGMVAGGIVLSLGATGVLGIIIFGMNTAIAANATNIGTLRLDMTAIQTRMNTAEGNINVIEDELTEKTHELTALKNKTQNQSGEIGLTTFSGNMNIGTPLISTTTLYGSTAVFGDLLLNGVDLNGVNLTTINVRTAITTNQTNITNLQNKTSNMSAINGVSTTFTDDLLLYNLLTGNVNIGETLAALRDVTANMTTVPTVSTNFTGDVFLGGTLNLRTTIEKNVDDILTLQQDLTDANTTITGLQNQINHQASHITSLENQIDILNLQFDTMNFSNGFMDQISNNPFDNPFIDLFEHT